MAKDKRKPRAQDAGPTQPSWRQPPARSRKELRRMRSTTTPVSEQSSKPMASHARRDEKTPSRIGAGELTRRVLVLVFAAILTFGMMQLLRLPQVTVSAISTQIGGVQRITREQIYDASKIEGRNIFLLRPGDIAAAVSQLDGIAKAQVHVRLPNQVLIDVEEHVPLITWQSNATTVWLTADGATVPQTGQAPPLALKGRQNEDLPDAKSPLAPVLLKSLAALRAAQPDVTEVYYSKSQGLSFRTPEGWEVWLGDSNSLANKLALLEVARQEITRLGRQAQVIDLRYSNQSAIWW